MPQLAEPRGFRGDAFGVRYRIATDDRDRHGLLGGQVDVAEDRAHAVGARDSLQQEPVRDTISEAHGETMSEASGASPRRRRGAAPQRFSECMTVGFRGRAERE